MTRPVLAGVVAGVVAADESPARLVAVVWIAAVEEVGVEEEGVARFHLAVDPLQVLLGQFGSGWVCAGLPAKAAMLDPITALRAD